jgi:hypothetical protein
MHLLQILNDLPVDDSTQEITKTLSKFGWRILIDLFSVFVLVRFVYFPIYKHRELFFTFFIFNIIIFLICFLLNKVELSMGAAFGLFAVFSMLRYRTEDISIKDMTYLFLVIAIGLIAAVTKIKDTSDMYEYLFLGIINAIIITTTYLLESNVLMKKEHAKVITYENITLITADKEEELKEDIKLRTGLTVHRLNVQKIDFLRDAAQIKIYYYEV